MARYKPAADVLRAEIDGDEVLLNTRTGIYHLVNRTGRSLLLKLDEGLTVEESVDALAAEHSRSTSEVALDVQAFLNAMCERGLLEVVQ